MALVPGYRHDIFVSYAHVDNQPDTGVAEGWVSTLVEGLRRRLDAKLGRREAYSLWMDPKLAGHVPITPEIMENLRKSVTLLVVLSPGYLSSEWCRQEMGTFLNTVKEQERSGTRVFIVERTKMEESGRPSELKELELVGYPFWVQEHDSDPPRTLGDPQPHPEDHLYYDALNKLSYELAQELRRLERAGEKPLEHPVAGTAPTVFLAEATDDLDPERSQVQEYLEQAGLRVLPDTWYPRDLTAFRKAAERDLARCVLFVQLISAVVGRRSPEAHGYARLQYDLAVDAKKPMLQWRSADLDTANIKDEGLRAFVGSETVQAVRLEEFKREVVKRTSPKPPTPPKRPLGDPLAAFVFVNAEESDHGLAETLAEVLTRNNLGYTLPLRGGKPGEFRKDLERSMVDCDALIIIYGNSPNVWVREQMGWFKRVRGEAPLKASAIYEGPPEPKDPLGSRLPGMAIINGRLGLSEAELQLFLNALAPVGEA